MSKKLHTSSSLNNVLHLPKYFDFVAATPVHPDVLNAMQPLFGETFYNPSALYSGARNAKDLLNLARADVAQTLGAKPSEIVFTAGGSESIAMAIHGVMARYENKDKSVIISAIEHDAVRRTAERYRCDTVGVDTQGLVIVQELASMLESNDDVALVSIMYVSNEIGAIQDIAGIASIIKTVNKQRRKKGLETILFHVDASQAPLYLDCNPTRLGVDLMTLNGGKMYGPKQSGVLYVHTGVELSPLLYGGGQEFGLRSGTENVAFAVGFAKALQLAGKSRDERAKKTTEVRDYCIGKLEEIGGEVYGHRTKRVANSILVGFEGVDNEALMIHLDNVGFSVAIGSACHASSGEPSYVLKAIGLSDAMAQSTLRISINEYTTKKDCDALLAELKQWV